MSDIAKILVKCKQWRWTAGMLTVSEMGTRVRLLSYLFESKVHHPCLEDPATIGCLWAMLMEHKHTAFEVETFEDGMLTLHCVNQSAPSFKAYGTRGEILARALLHVWGT